VWQADFRKINKEHAHQAAYNYALFEKLGNYWTDYLADWLTRWPDTERWIQEYFMSKPATNRDRVKTERIPTWLLDSIDISGDVFEELMQLPYPAPVHISYRATHGVNGFRIQLKTRQIFMAQINSVSQKASNRKLQYGDSVKSLLSRYGSPSRIVVGNADTTFYMFEQANLIAEIVHGRIRKWMIYQTKML